MWGGVEKTVDQHHQLFQTHIIFTDFSQIDNMPISVSCKLEIFRGGGKKVHTNGELVALK